MTNNFFSVTAQGHIGSEKVDTVFHYMSATAPHASPDVVDLAVVGNAVKTALSTKYCAAMVSDYILDSWRVAGYDALGAVSDAIPYILADGAVGIVTPARDGNAHVAILKCALGDLHRIAAASSNLRRAYFAWGPLNNTFVNNDGSYVTVGFTALNTLMSSLPTPLNAFATADLILIKVSHTESRVRSAPITAWRPVISISPRLQASLRLSRNNNR